MGDRFDRSKLTAFRWHCYYDGCTWFLNATTPGDRVWTLARIDYEGRERGGGPQHWRVSVRINGQTEDLTLPTVEEAKAWAMTMVRMG